MNLSRRNFRQRGVLKNEISSLKCVVYTRLKNASSLTATSRAMLYRHNKVLELLIFESPHALHCSDTGVVAAPAAESPRTISKFCLGLKSPKGEPRDTRTG